MNHKVELHICLQYLLIDDIISEALQAKNETELNIVFKHEEKKGFKIKIKIKKASFQSLYALLM